MSCSGGLNQFLSVPVPGINGDGALLDVSGLVAAKTLYLSGTYEGVYVVLGSHDDSTFVPIAKFDGGGGPQSVRCDIKLSLKSIKIHRSASKTVVVNLAAQETCSC